MMKNYFYELALSLVEGVGAITAKNLISYCGSAEQVFKTTPGKLKKIPLVGNSTVESLGKQSILFKLAEEQLKQIESRRTKLFFYTEESYPERLKEIPDAPILLFGQGSVDFSQKSIAIVGTRKATEYGKKMTEMLLEQLKDYQPIVISGLAYGIDICVHRACLKNELPTVAVMANGLDKIYPSEHQHTATQIAEEGGILLTENHFGVEASAMRFPARNRIIAGLADAVIVVEARAKGGALITADLANGYHREVFAVPGNLNQVSSEGCNFLIKNNQASLISSAQDLIEALNWDQKQKDGRQTQLRFEEMELNQEEKNILDFLREKEDREVMIDEISFRLNMNVGKLNASLLNMELLGILKSLPGKKISLN